MGQVAGGHGPAGQGAAGQGAVERGSAKAGVDKAGVGKAGLGNANAGLGKAGLGKAGLGKAKSGSGVVGASGVGTGKADMDQSGADGPGGDGRPMRPERAAAADGAGRPGGGVSRRKGTSAADILPDNDIPPGNGGVRGGMGRGGRVVATAGDSGRVGPDGRGGGAPAGLAADVVLDIAESPLGWLSRRPGRDGRPLLSAAQVEAGERLRLDFTRGGLMPRVTQAWQAGGARAARRSGARGTAGDLGDAALDARARFNRAVSAVGPELGGVLIDVCCFLKGLEAVEAERVWPVRSAKIVLALALSRLAAHYGLSEAARGPDAARMRSWGAEGYRPEIG